MILALSLLIMLPQPALAGPAAAENLPPRLPPQALNLTLKAPITKWDEALPLGNGLLGGRQPRWDRDGVRKTGANFEVDLKAGESLEAKLSRPASIPDRPADATDPLVVRPPGPIRANKLPHAGDVRSARSVGSVGLHRPAGADRKPLADG